MKRSTWVLPCAWLVLVGCGRTAPSTVAPEPPATAATVVLPSAASGPSSVASSQSASAVAAASGAPSGSSLAAAASSAPVASAAPPDPRCSGASLDLNALLKDRICTVDRRAKAPRLPASALKVTVDAPPRLAPGTEGEATVTFANVSGSDVALELWAPDRNNGPELGFGAGGLGAGSAPPKPTRPEALHIAIGRASADGRSFDATWVMLGAMTDDDFRVHLPAGGNAQLRVLVAARGFLPGKQYPMSDSIDRPTDPLPPGRYKMTLKLPVEVEPPAWPVIDLVVGR
jgi:hypothetical protein